MNDSEFGKLSINYQNLSERFINHSKHYQDGYAIYEKKSFVVKDENLDFLNQFRDIPFKAFFSKLHLEKYDFGGLYYNSPTLIETERTINVHTELSMVIFYYMIFKLKDDVIKFETIIQSDAFKEKLDGFYKIDKYSVRYSLSMHNLFYQFMLASVPNFDKIYHLFHWTNSGLMVVESNDMVIRFERIQNILDALENMYDFSKIQIT